MPETYAVIMAGGVGARFWPRSREKSPKQLLEIAGKGTMIQHSVKRLEGFISPEKMFVVTNKHQRSLVIKQLPDIPEENILVEPVGRNTAPCIGLAALHVRKRDPSAVMVVLPADHMIQNSGEFVRVLSLAADVASRSKGLLTIGIKATHPETGYGYIQYSQKTSENPYASEGIFRVKTFAEKPNLQTAERFLASGDFVWNSGMFVWSAEAILLEMERCLPDLHRELGKIDQSIESSSYQSTLETVYGMIRGISIDYGVMEKAEDVYVIPAEFGWNDIGSWDEVYRISGKDDNGNSVTGRVIQTDTTNSLIYTEDRLIATVGVEGLIVIDTGDAILVCKRGKSQDVKEISDFLRRKKMTEYL
ncbi:MAG: sugar phosphate nucleotidyltransferase [Ignavibacteria bacterium]|nr:sugar phosphate nucleotidyltransferase [Ignavibacteria bacterium]